MHHTFRQPPFLSTRRHLGAASVMVLAAAALVGCATEPVGFADGTATNVDGGPGSGGVSAGVSGGPGGTGSASGAPGATSVGGGGGGLTSGVGPATTGVNTTGQPPTTPGVTSGVIQETCVDVEPPPDPEWPEATCERWANETTACSESWFAQYCDLSCARCVPAGGIPPTAPEDCVDVEPPFNPEWPDATCESWRFEADACDEPWFSSYCDVTCRRCEPVGGLEPEPMPPDCSALPNVTGGQGHATRYWDCCQTHCSQFSGHRCSADGVSVTGSQNNACQGGNSFACYDEAPRAVSDCLSYGHIAVANPSCGQCYRIQFTGESDSNPNDRGSALIRGKQMIVKVTNTGGDVGGTQFDLMVPGGGVGRFNACSGQWGTNDLGEQFGGFLPNCSGTHADKKDCVRRECQKIPAGDARDGCLWFADWFELADNPRFTSEVTACPF